MRFLLLLATLVPCSALAESDFQQTHSPYFELDTDGVDPLPLQETRAEIYIAGVIAHVRVHQVYQNRGSEALEAVYVFPAGTRAALFGMRMKVGEREIEAKIADREKAQELYRRARDSGRSASLLSQERPNVFSMRVANIMPSDRIEVVLDYTELLVPTAGVYQLVYPAVVGPRYSAEEEEWLTNPHLDQEEAKPRFDISVRIAAGTELFGVSSPSHTITPTFTEGDVVQVELSDERGGDRDFVLRYRLVGDRIQTGMLLFPGSDSTEPFFLAMVQPPARPAANAILPRDVVFLLDISGSMAGFPLRVAKRLMTDLLSGLRSHDRFNVLLFAGNTVLLAKESIEATADNIERAERFVGHHGGVGRTHLLPALSRALSLPRDEGRSTAVIVITDGFVATERQVFDLIRDNLNDANLFAFGIGSSMNRHLVEGIAHAGMGEPFFVLSEREATRKAKAFRTYVEAPLLTDCRVSFDGFDAYDTEPEQLPDLFASRPILLFGKYRGSARGRLILEGRTALGPYRQVIDVSRTKPSDDNTALPYLWARHRLRTIADLGEEELAEEMITKIGLRYNLLTRYTSFVAVDPTRRNPSAHQITMVQPLPLPLGMRSTAPAQLRGRRMRAHGSLDRSSITRVIQTNMNEIQRLYERTLMGNPAAEGKVVLSWVVEEDGRVSKVRVKTSTINAPQFVAQLVRLVRSWRFPASKGGKITVVYPFSFRSV